MKELEIRRRKWVAKFDGKPGKIQAEIGQRISLLKSVVWNGDPEPFDWWVSGLLGVIPGDLAILRAFSACLSAKTEQRIVGNILCLFSGIQTVEYFSRAENKKCRGLLYEKPSRIPTGFVHLFDLSVSELENGLKKAMKAHGIQEQQKFFLKLAETTPVLPQKCGTKTPEEYLHKAEAEKHAFLGAQKRQLKTIGTTPSILNLKTLSKFAENFFTPATMHLAEKRLADISGKYSKETLQKNKYKSEQLKTLAALGKDGKSSASKMIQEQMLKLVSGVFPGMGELFAHMVCQPAAAPWRAGPDELYRLEREIFACRKEVQRQCELHHNDLSRAFVASRKIYKELTRAQFDKYRGAAEGNFSAALSEAAEKLGYSGVAYAERVYKQARSNARINAIWAQFLVERFPKSDRVSPDNFPATPPVRC